MAPIPSEIELSLGMELELSDEDDQIMLVVVTEIKEESVVIDDNAPLAGQSLTFELELLTIE